VTNFIAILCKIVQYWLLLLSLMCLLHIICLSNSWSCAIWLGITRAHLKVNKRVNLRLWWFIAINNLNTATTELVYLYSLLPTCISTKITRS